VRGEEGCFLAESSFGERVLSFALPFAGKMEVYFYEEEQIDLECRLSGSTKYTGCNLIA